MKVVAITDKKGSAIDRLAQGVKKHLNFDYQVIDVHPKRPDTDQLERLEAARDADLIHFMYFRTAEMLLEKYDWLKSKPKILDHYNPYSITESDWNSYDLVTGCNEQIARELTNITSQPVEHIPLTVDTDFWTFNREWKPNNKVLMVANRIESKKGILEVAQACEKVNAQFHLVGNISDGDYFREVLQATTVNFHQNITDEALRELYWNCSLHVCNSHDNFESGTLPILEAMLTGCPVLTRKIGHVAELNNDENMFIHKGEKEDVDTLAKLIKELLNDPDKLRKMRDKAWDTAKRRSNRRRAYIFRKLYRQVLYPDQTSVSVIMPVCGKPKITEQSVQAVKNQTHKNIELILVNDGQEQVEGAIENYQGDYGLARARNKGIIESTGEVIVFCDQRIVMKENAIEELLKKLTPRTWVYGSKGTKKDFVENFSAIYRDDIIRMGMFNERIDAYGGMSQEIRNRARYQGIKTVYVEEAQAEQIGSSKNKHTKKQEIIKMKDLLWQLNLE